MTSRERIKRFYNKQPIDKIPSGLGSSETSGFHVLAYETLKEILGVKSGLNRMYTSMTTAIGEPEFLEKADTDYIILNTGMSKSPFWGAQSDGTWKNRELLGKTIQINNAWDFVYNKDGSVIWEPYGWKMASTALYFDAIPTEKNIFDFDFPDPDQYKPSRDISDDYLRHMEESAKWIYQNTDFSIQVGETITDLQYDMGCTEQWWMTLASRPDIASAILEKATEAALSQLKLVDQAIGKYADTMLIAHDIGDSRGVTVGTELFRKVYKPNYKKLFGGWKKITDMKINFHSCGAIFDILPDLIECGVDIINPVQISAMNMEPAKLKKAFGNDIIFFGGSYDAILNPKEDGYDKVYNRVKSTIETLSSGGGYIFAGVHNLPGDMPKEHARAMMDAYNDVKHKAELLQK